MHKAKLSIMSLIDILIFLPSPFIHYMTNFVGICSNTMPLASVELPLVNLTIGVFHCTEGHLAWFELTFKLIPCTENIFTHLFLIIFPLPFKFISVAIFVCALAIPSAILYFAFIAFAVTEFYHCETIKIIFFELTFVLDLTITISAFVFPFVDPFAHFLWHVQISFIIISILVVNFSEPFNTISWPKPLYFCSVSVEKHAITIFFTQSKPTPILQPAMFVLV